LEEVRKCHQRLNRTMPTDSYAADPKMKTSVHAAAKRGQAAMLVQRNSKNYEAVANKQTLLRDDELELWMRQQFQVVS
ncbi:unnamed protein product, partial [Symbiodinium sp. CCMP2456]